MPLFSPLQPGLVGAYPLASSSKGVVALIPDLTTKLFVFQKSISRLGAGTTGGIKNLGFGGPTSFWLGEVQSGSLTPVVLTAAFTRFVSG